MFLNPPPDTRRKPRRKAQKREERPRIEATNATEMTLHYSLRTALSGVMRRGHVLASTVHVASPRAYSTAPPDTIYSVSSGPVTKAGVCVLRTSGPAAKFCVDSLLKKQGSTLLKPRRAYLKDLYCPQSSLKLDKALVLWFPAPHSFTGEDVFELHVHGSVAVVSGVLSAFEHLNKTAGSSGSDNNVGRIRPAEAGEFTRRAFQNGKMDLTEVEGLADLLEAQTGVQRVQALKQMEGHLRVKFEKWREEIVHCLAHMEAVIDFGDDDRENDVTDDACRVLYPRMERLLRDLNEHLDDGRRGEIIRDGYRIVLAGPPNAGKSSVLNVMARRPAAIVSPEPGTTRDLIEVKLNIGGVCCVLTDTAGIRSQSDSSAVTTGINAIEMEGMSRAREALSRADLRVFICDSSDLHSRAAMTAMLPSSEKTHRKNTVVLLNKIDLVKDTDVEIGAIRDRYDLHEMSCTSGAGVREFEAALETHVRTALAPREGVHVGTTESDTLSDRLSGITRQRHRFHIEQCVSHLHRFLGRVDGDLDTDSEILLDIKAEELRLASQELAKVTGHVDIEELLDVIFRDFCIGK